MKKIMFNDKYGLTKAVLEGRKTMTRRICSKGAAMEALEFDNWSWAKYHIGEVVAVAQNYNEVFDEFADIVYLQGKPVPDNLKAFGGQSDVTLPKTLPGWNNKMFVKADLMPHRIRITNVRVERLQDISDEDCLREGIRKMTFDTFSFDSWKFFARSPREAFAALIDKVSGKGIWNRNPWVFVYEFERVKYSHDA